MQNRDARASSVADFSPRPPLLWRIRGVDQWQSPALPVSPALHPLALGAALTLAINDHWLKYSGVPRIITGKLSDIAGMIVGPCWLAALLCMSLWLLSLSGLRVHFVLRRSILLISIVIIGGAFAAMKLSTSVALFTSEALSLLTPSRVIADPSDCLALPFLWVAWKIGCDDISRGPLGMLRNPPRALTSSLSEAEACGASKAAVAEVQEAANELLVANSPPHLVPRFRHAMHRLARFD